MLLSILAVLIAYLFGSLSSAIITCRIMRLPDPRTQGSGNPGATNVLRIGGKKAAAITMLGDVLKGFIPVLAAKLMGFDNFTLAMVMAAAVLGHLYPVFFRFCGGKGIATLIGCLLALSPPTGFAFIATWVIVAAIFRYASLASLTAVAISPFILWLFMDDASCYITLMGISLLLFYRHRVNIIKLAEGRESKIGQKSEIQKS